MKLKMCLVLSSFMLMAAPLMPAAIPPQKDYLTAVEADKIRDAEKDTNERIRLFLSFAEDRLKKFQYELEHPSTNRHGDMLNSLLNAYLRCVHHPPHLIQLGTQTHAHIRP